ncbi:hypothetical protein [Gordonibacter massiliensis (ex Traore et al. 2017)]|uniref:hypothetical protein n=1 Tax=Gordonibacter massiliensis (ex Traore et al. 2017) TaxID=1841863 RepID=UPI001C8BF4F1|nr:hypothetical protein [Gordonibacter massiliensis (ex Traore et al. 2017)]MBX9033833.1 hypothetical protein [Gordonibacter massiliensis (ex Traore et al. 2017)]
MDIDDFKESYCELQGRIAPTAEARARVAEAVRREAFAGKAERCGADGSDRAWHRAEAADRTARRHKSAAPRFFAAAACIALVCAGLMAVATDGGGGRNRFDIQAYAVESGTVQPSCDGLVAFSYGEVANATSDEGGGQFTGCMFQIAGESIESAEVSLDRGELYRCDEEWVQAEGGEIEALMAAEGDWQASLAKVYADGRAHLFRFTRLGPSVVEGGSGASGMRFGIWLPDANDGEGSSSGPGANMLPLDWLDGAKLTVSVRFADGSSEAKEVVLHTGYLETTMVEENGVEWRVAVPELADGPDPSGQSTYYTLYGTIQ